MAVGQPPPALLVLGAPRDLGAAAVVAAVAVRLVLGDGGGLGGGEHAQSAGGVASGEDGGHPEVRGQAGLPKGTLLGHLRGQVGPQASGISVD